MDRAELERLDRESLVLRAQAAGIKRARVLTRPELVDDLVRLDPQVDASQLKRTRGFFGLARDLLSRVVERGLHLPDAAERFREALVVPPSAPRPDPQAIPTVTLAEIYAAQGHRQRAIDTLRRVLAEEPEHGAARALLETLEAADYVAPAPPLPPEPEVEPAAAASEDDVDAPDVQAATEREADAAPIVEEDEPEVEAAPDLEVAAAPAISEEELDQLLDAPPIAPLEDVDDPIPSTEPAPLAAVASVPDLPALKLHVADRCVAVPTRRGLYVWWELSPASAELAREAFFFVRFVMIAPSWDGPVTTVRDVVADPSSASLFVVDLPRDVVVRVAIGFMPNGELVPVAHSPALELGADGALREWTFGDTASSLEDPQVRSAIERAAHV